MKRKTKILITLLAVFSVLSLSGCGCKQSSTKQYSLTLEIWGLFDDSDAYSEIFETYKKANLNIASIVYKKLSPDTYQKELLEALASGKGPDIFLIQNTWLPSFSDKMIPAAPEIINEQKLREQFADTVADDFLLNGFVYALPLSMDSLALYYNKDLFNQAGVASPPMTWEEFMETSKKLTTIDGFGNIRQSGAAMGTAYNINRSTDIVSLIMIQNNLDIVNRNSGSADFSNPTGERAINFYTQFARSGNLTWNPRMHYSIDAFSEGNLAMMLNYSWQIPVLKSKAPKLNFAVAEVPQFKNNPKKIGYANYWGLGVSKNQQIKSSRVSSDNAPAISDATRNIEAWKLIAYMALAPTTPNAASAGVIAGSQNNSDAPFDSAKKYLEKTEKPAARRDIINEQKSDARLGVFALGNLYAKSWFQVDPAASEAIIAEIVEDIISGKNSANEAIKVMSARINNLVRK